MARKRRLHKRFKGKKRNPGNPAPRRNPPLLADLAEFTLEKQFPPDASDDHRLFYVGRDNVHGILAPLFSRGTSPNGATNFACSTRVTYEGSMPAYRARSDRDQPRRSRSWVMRWASATALCSIGT